MEVGVHADAVEHGGNDLGQELDDLEPERVVDVHDGVHGGDVVGRERGVAQDVEDGPDGDCGAKLLVRGRD